MELRNKRQVYATTSPCVYNGEVYTVAYSCLLSALGKGKRVNTKMDGYGCSYTCAHRSGVTLCMGSLAHFICDFQGKVPVSLANDFNL